MAQDPDTPSRRHPAPHPGRGTEAEVWLARHGEVHSDWQGRVYGSLDVPLSLRGESETEAVIERFRPLELGAVFSSNLQRALRLGRGVAEATGAPLAIESGLAEIDRGEWQGMPVADLLAEREHEVSAFYDDPWTWDGHGGETDRDVLERAAPVLERSLDSGAKRVLLACHYNVMRVLLASMVDIPPARSFRLRIDLSRACVLRDRSRGWTLERCNVLGPRA
jgi:broad specificity phosphatase PhoE